MPKSQVVCLLDFVWGRPRRNGPSPTFWASCSGRLVTAAMSSFPSRRCMSGASTPTNFELEYERFTKPRRWSWRLTSDVDRSTVADRSALRRRCCLPSRPGQNPRSTVRSNAMRGKRGSSGPHTSVGPTVSARFMRTSTRADSTCTWWLMTTDGLLKGFILATHTRQKSSAVVTPGDTKQQLTGLAALPLKIGTTTKLVGRLDGLASPRRPALALHVLLPCAVVKLNSKPQRQQALRGMPTWQRLQPSLPSRPRNCSARWLVCLPAKPVWQ